MAAWPQRCQAAVPSQPFPELLVIAHTQSDSQRQMVFKLNGCGRNPGAGLIGHAHARGLPSLGRSFQRHSPQMAVSRKWHNPDLSFHAYLWFFTLFQHNQAESFCWVWWSERSLVALYHWKLLDNALARGYVCFFSHMRHILSRCCMVRDRAGTQAEAVDRKRLWLSSLHLQSVVIFLKL